MAHNMYDKIPELSGDAQAIARRKKIAEAMIAKSQQQLPTNQMAGRVVAPVSWTQGLGKLLQAYAGQQQLKDADADTAGLADKRQQMVADAMTGINQTAQGQPAVGPEGPQIPVEGDKRQAIMDAMTSNLPEVQRYGQAMTSFEGIDAKAAQTQATNDLKVSENQANRDVRMQQLQMQIESREKMGEQANDLRAALANMQDEARRDIAAMNASNRGGSNAAPSMTEIVDPTDPTRLLRVNARTYQGGGLGSEGVLGVSGKEPTAAKKEEKASLGQGALSDSIDTLRGYFRDLDEKDAISNSDKSTMTNIGAGISSSGVGQFTGRMLGTEEQTLRNSINMQRPLLLQAIKQATGMSSKQMDSNAELKLWLRSATDPTLDIKSNMDALDSIERKYISGAKGSEEKVLEVDW